MNGAFWRKAVSLMYLRSGWVLLFVATALAVAAKSQAQYLSTRHVRDVVSNGVTRAVGRLPENQFMSLDIVLPLRDPAGLETFLEDLYNPDNFSHRQFLTPAEFTREIRPQPGGLRCGGPVRANPWPYRSWWYTRTGWTCRLKVQFPR